MSEPETDKAGAAVVGPEEVVEPEEKPAEEVKPQEEVKEVDYKAESEKWQKSYKEKESHFDRTINNKERENQELKKRLEEAEKLLPPKPSKDGFERLDIEQALELKITDPKKYALYQEAEKKADEDLVLSIIERKEKQREEKEQMLKIQDTLYSDYPELDKRSEKFNEEFYNKVDSLMKANAMDIRQAKIAAENVRLKDGSKEAVEKAREEAYVSKKKKGDENIAEKPSPVKPSIELSVEEKKVAKNMGITEEAYAKAKEEK